MAASTVSYSSHYDFYCKLPEHKEFDFLLELLVKPQLEGLRLPYCIGAFQICSLMCTKKARYD
jgi:hypothetical protein